MSDHEQNSVTHASCKGEVTTVEDLDEYPDGSVFLNSRGFVVVLDTVHFAPEEPVRVFFSIDREEDWPIDRLGFPAQLLHRPAALSAVLEETT